MLSFVGFRAGLWATAGLLPLIGVSFAFAILLVNQDLEMFHYVFAAFCFSQVYVFVVKLRYMSLFLKEKLLQQFLIECHKTKTKPVTYQLNYSANLKR